MLCRRPRPCVRHGCLGPCAGLAEIFGRALRALPIAAVAKPRWTEKLRTRADARASRTQWQAAAKLLLGGADAEAVTKAIELALMYEARLDFRMANSQR